MKRKIFIFAALSLFTIQSPVSGHCQMPCGIYHDDMVFEMLDQYLETMYKAVVELGHINFNSSNKDKNQWIRWVMLKDKESDNASHLICDYFLQQKIKPDEEDTAAKVTAAHKLLVQIVRIKQNVDVDCVKTFAEEWGKFKLLFHVKGYQCQMENKRLSDWDKVKFRVDEAPKEDAAKDKKAPLKK